MTKTLILDPRRGKPSASSMYRLKECPGSLALSNRVIRQGSFVPQNPWAAAGTRIHGWLAIELVDGLAADITKTMRNGEIETAHKCAQLRNELIGQWGGIAEPEWIVERRFWYRINDVALFSAQPDLIALDRSGRRALIINYKTGRTEAEPAADNLQLRTEVVLLKANTPELEEIQAAIVEPLVSWDSERVSYSGEAFRQAEEEILQIVSEPIFNSEHRVAGGWCQYCPARLYCQEAHDYVQTVPAPKNAIIELPRGERGTILWEKIKFAKKLLADLEEAYTVILETDPAALPGYCLPAQGREKRFVPFPDKLKEALSDYLTASEIDGAATFHLTKIAEVLGLKHRLSGRELDRLFDKLTKEAVSVTHDAPFIRPLTKRERENRALQSS